MASVTRISRQESSLNQSIDISDGGEMSSTKEDVPNLNKTRNLNFFKLFSNADVFFSLYLRYIQIPLQLDMFVRQKKL
jgi:hypothetical protein